VETAAIHPRMLANADGSGLRTLTAVPFRQSVHPTWLP
jgi:hypothetical protein